VIAVPALYLLSAQVLANPNIQIAAQNCYTVSSGAYTGEISPSQLVDAKIPWVVLGHSERRTLFGDTDSLVADKTKAALAVGLSVILCVGETLEEREAGTTMKVVERQLAAVAAKVSDWSKIVVAYEPVWAIGTGKVATCQQVTYFTCDYWGLGYSCWNYRLKTYTRTYVNGLPRTSRKRPQRLLASSTAAASMQATARRVVSVSSALKTD
jgi:triosephosphate isomerase